MHRTTSGPRWAAALADRRRKCPLFRTHPERRQCTQCAGHSAQTRPSRSSRTHQSPRSQRHMRHSSPPGCSARIPKHTVRISRPYRRSHQDTPRTQCCCRSADCRHHSACMSLLCQSIPRGTGHKHYRWDSVLSRHHRQCKCMPMCHMNHPRQHSPECNRRTPCCRRSAVCHPHRQCMCRLIRQIQHCRLHTRCDPCAARTLPGTPRTHLPS